VQSTSFQHACCIWNQAFPPRMPGQANGMFRQSFLVHYTPAYHFIGTQGYQRHSHAQVSTPRGIQSISFPVDGPLGTFDILGIL
jgi:hypothetical protein